MRTLLLPLLLALPATALAAPPAGVVAPGLETICAAQEEVDTDEDVVGTSVIFLEDQASLETEHAASMAGVTLSGDTPRFATADSGVVYGARAVSDTSDTFVLSVDGMSQLEFAGKTIPLQSGSVMVVDYAQTKVRTTTVSIFDAEGSLSSSLSTIGTVGALPGSTERLQLSNGGLDGVLVVHAYGDIIIGGMCLECWDD